jgi:YbbR domain-containing protein
VRRIYGRLVHNWPLKLAAVLLATLMYGGLALSQNTQTYQGVIPVQVVNQPQDTFVLTRPASVTAVRYFAPSGVPPAAANSFVATVDLAGVVATGQFVTVKIDVKPLDERIRVLGYDPPQTSIQLDPIDKKSVPVRVEHGTVPDGLTLGPTSVDPAMVTITGPQSVLDGVEAARADVIIQPTGIDIDQDVPLTPIDKLGNALSPLDVTPPTARVVIPVFSDRQSRTLPVNPIITGTPAAGFEIESVTVQPLVMLVAGDADQLAQLNEVDTDPIAMTGVSANETVSVGLALPTGVVAVGNETVSVTIKIRPVTGTRTFSAGLRLVGASNELTYALSVDRVLVTIGGSTADLDRLSGAALVMDLDVAGLKAGVHAVPVAANLPAGTTLVAASPASVTVTIGVAAAPVSPSPAAPATPTPSPSGS